jgi:F-type H+-transporting ATPase subunit epsilon
MAGTLRCSVVTPESSVFDEGAAQVTVPAHDGEVGILPGHARLLARLGVGELRIRQDGKTHRMFVEGGFVQVADDRVTVLTDTACAIEQIDVPAAAKRVEELRGKGKGEALAAATHRHLTMKRVRERGGRSQAS